MRRVPSSAPPTPLNSSASVYNNSTEEQIPLNTTIPLNRQNGMVYEQKTAKTSAPLQNENGHHESNGNRANTPIPHSSSQSNLHVSFKKIPSVPLQTNKNTALINGNGNANRQLTRVATVVPKARLQRTNKSQVHDYPPSPLHSDMSYHGKIFDKVSSVKKQQQLSRIKTRSESDSDRDRHSNKATDKQLTPMPEETATPSPSSTRSAPEMPFPIKPDLTVEIPPRPNFLEFDRENSVGGDHSSASQNVVLSAEDSTLQNLMELVQEQFTNLISARLVDLTFQQTRLGTFQSRQFCHHLSSHD
ncbi:hypothetical protein WR25_26073 [Diploscapter pachys]|uniref:Uncharacterized protein n=1 Tax=Diploscapter pachys TaxID=2018661 RepID=A0A2A2K7P9_9BILA|nr:hypothetical protein WR25_26073 [Diploscapter pachys]